MKFNKVVVLEAYKSRKFRKQRNLLFWIATIEFIIILYKLC